MERDAVLNEQERASSVAFLHSLEREDGGYASDVGEAGGGLQHTVSVVKALELLGAAPRDRDQARAFVDACGDGGGAAFRDRPGGERSVLATALGLIALNELDGAAAARLRAPAAMRFMAEQALSAADHFMVIAAHEEGRFDGAAPPAAVEFFERQRATDGTFGEGVRANAIASSALLRARVRLEPVEALVRRLLVGQAEDGGFADGGGVSDLMTTYTAMRALFLLRRPPDLHRLARYVTGLRNDDGGYGASPGAPSTAGDTYQALSILAWADELKRADDGRGVARGDIRSAVETARRGDVAALGAWLERGGDPDRYDDEGWTPLLAAASRGRSAVVDLLLFHDIAGAPRASSELRFVAADALPIYMAGQSGDLETVKLLLRARPEHVFEISEVNGHTVLLQAAFFGSTRHLELAEHLLEHAGDILSLPPGDVAALEHARRRLTVATNVRGFNALGMARLWKNEPMAALISRYDRTTDDERRAYLGSLLERIRPPEPRDEQERHAQALTDSLVQAIERGLEAMKRAPAGDAEAIARTRAEVLGEVEKLVETPEFNVNRLGGPLQQPPVVVAVTGEDANEHVAELRLALTRYLLDHGADPDLPEKHPMAVDAVIRAAVLGHFDALRLIAEYMSHEAFAAAFNEKPPVNGLTALHDSIHRALTASPERLDSRLAQIRWAVEHGARADIEDHTGRTQADLAREGLADPVFAANARRVLEALHLEA